MYRLDIIYKPTSNANPMKPVFNEEGDSADGLILTTS